MFKRIMPFLLSASIAHSVLAQTPAQPVESSGAEGPQHHWSCHVAEGAKVRKQQVERNVLPRMAFIGETRAALIEARMALHRTPALSVAVIRDGVLDWNAAWGQLQAGGVQAGCDSLFQAGSLAKPATVLAALRLQQGGVVDLDDDIETLLTSWDLPQGKQTRANPVSLRNLFTHTAGITPGGYDGYAQGQLLPSDRQTVAAEAPSNARKVEVLEAPGTSLRYSGGGYTVAEIALQDRLREPFEQIMRAWLIAPVGMKQAEFTQPLPASRHPYAARGHAIDGSMVSGGWHDHPEQAAAGLWATASDLAALLIELRQGWQGRSDVFTQQSIRELLADPIDGHAYGFRLIGDGDQIFLTHYGGTVGYRAGMTLNLETGNGAVYLSNSDDGSDLGVEFLGAVASVYGWPMFRQVSVERAAPPADVLMALAGRYAFEDGPTISVVYEQGAVDLLFPNGDRYTMVPIKGEALEFIHADTAVRARFQGEGAGTTIQLYGDTGRRVEDKK